MKASELRIGNIINDKGDFHEVAGIQFNGTEWWIAYKEYFEWFRFKDETGIPLTKEWLLKFGFEAYDDCGTFQLNVADCVYCIYYHTESKKIDLYTGHEEFDSNDPDESDHQNIVSIKNIEYVHQLQNLYFALTGEKLTIRI